VTDCPEAPDLSGSDQPQNLQAGEDFLLRPVVIIANLHYIARIEELCCPDPIGQRAVTYNPAVLDDRWFREIED
jgi:hypothetical protein